MVTPTQPKSSPPGPGPAPPGSTSPGHLVTWSPRLLWYGALVVGAIALFFLIDAWGRDLVAPDPAAPGVPGAVPAGGKPDALVHVLVALTAVLITGRLLGLLFRYVGQPPVIGEVVGGILLGPSLLGQVWPEAATFILPPSVAPYLAVIAQLGVILYMFLVGLELNPAVLRERARATVAISHASIVVPFLLGAALALVLYPRLSTNEVSFTSFALFVGVATSITAFPVLARILTDRRMQKTPLGIMALGCAATDDVTAWCLLAFVVGVAQAQVGGAFLVLGLTAAYIGFMFLVVRPVAGRLLARLDERRLTPGVMALVLGALLLSALTTEVIGVHAIFGAFLLGAVIPHDSAVARAFTRKLEDLVTVLLLPAFFAFTGMRTQIGLVSGMDQWLVCGLILLVATAGKFGGTLAAARLTGLGWRDGAALGLLMNTRGLMELIALNIGLDLRVISPTLFAMMVLMALATTMATTPLLHLLTPRPPLSDQAEPVGHAEGAKGGS
jgi:Kef-type K+ transport system membrane component KefB